MFRNSSKLLAAQQSRRQMSSTPQKERTVARMLPHSLAFRSTEMLAELSQDLPCLLTAFGRTSTWGVGTAILLKGERERASSWCTRTAAAHMRT